MARKLILKINILFLFLILALLSLLLNGCLKSKQVEKERKKILTEAKKETHLVEKGTEKERIKITLYFSDKQAMYLIPEEREIKKTEDVAKIALEELIKGPKDPKLFPTIPEGTKLLGIEVKDGLAKVNLSQDFKDNYPLGSAGENITIFSIVNTLTEFTSINKVRFLVEGKPLEVSGSNYDLVNQFFLRNEDIIKKLNSSGGK